MKALRTMATAGCLALLACGACGQGGLVPPGAPEPIMKTLNQVEARTPIDFIPFVISESGSYYLTGNLSGVDVLEDGIYIEADNVTIDLNGFTIDGEDNGGFGILQAAFSSGLRIMNGTVKNWTFDGIQLVERGIVSHCVVQGNGDDGIQIGTGGQFDHCVSEGNDFGYFVGSNVRISFSSAINNASEGFLISNSNVVESCVSAGNSYGIVMDLNNQIDGNTVVNNSGAGIAINGSGNLVVRNKVMYNGLNNNDNFDLGSGFNYVGTITDTPVGAGAWDNLKNLIIE